MHGIVDLLPEPYYTRVESLWDGLEETFGLNGIRITPYPHFSWNIAEHYERPELDRALADIAAEYAAFQVQTSGIGLFPAPVPVLFIAVRRNPSLDALHARIWEVMQPLAKGLSYDPRDWLPHITLAYGDLTSAQVPQVRAWLEAREAYEWVFDVTNLSYIYEPDGQNGDLQLSVQLQE